MSEHLEYHLTPNEKLVSYGKLVKLVKHQINNLSEEMKKIEQDTLYYVLHDEEKVKNYLHYQTAMDEWKWLLEVLEERYDLISFA